MPVSKDLSSNDLKLRNRLREWLDTSGLTIAQAAEELGLGTRTLEYYLKGYRAEGTPCPIPWNVWLAACAIGHGLQHDPDAWVSRFGQVFWFKDIPKTDRLALTAWREGVDDWSISDGFPEIEKTAPPRPRGRTFQNS